MKDAAVAIAVAIQAVKCSAALSPLPAQSAGSADAIKPSANRLPATRVGNGAEVIQCGQVTIVPAIKIRAAVPMPGSGPVMMARIITRPAGGTQKNSANGCTLCDRMNRSTAQAGSF